MKNMLVLFFSCCCLFQVQSQYKQNDENLLVEPERIIKANPKEGFPCFFQNFKNRFDTKNITSSKKELVCIIKVIVEKDGSFSDFEITNDKDGIGDQVICVLRNMPRWNPATHKGKIVRSRFTLPIKIMLD